MTRSCSYRESRLAVAWGLQQVEHAIVASGIAACASINPIWNQKMSICKLKPSGTRLREAKVVGRGFALCVVESGSLLFVMEKI